ncbi:phage tail sheath subtilisin-like domain-containing protein [Megamonas funiformis]|uniref:phage tail sheath subtilisin-like domain-containing protein n=1 Tax=Megamonas funiformis TaxID=437897 RepID=UPI0022E76EBD|nr:phage tail sheath subtilisin-like domain-containing protein [Megamonas funiformis]
MAKLGMPSVIISFKEAGIAAIERSQRGIVFLILEEEQAVIDKITINTNAICGKAITGQAITGNTEEQEVIENPFVIYTTDDIPSELSENNKDYITKCLLGYVTAPYRVKVFLQAKGKTGADKWQESLKKIAAERWDYLAIPTIEEEQLETVGTWIKTNRENKYKKVKAVLPGYDGDYEGIINFSNKFIKTATKTYTSAEYTARIAGLIAGTPMTISATYAPLSEVIDCDKYDLDENDEKVNNGEFFIWYDGTKYKMSRAMNSLVTTTEGKQEGYQTIKIVDIMDMIYDDVRTTAQDSYIGKYSNSYDNKCLLIMAITGYLKELEKEGLLQANYSIVELDTEAIKNYQLKNGLYTKEELANMSNDEINQLDTKKKVFLKGKIKIIDAMEDIELPFDI